MSKTVNEIYDEFLAKVHNPESDIFEVYSDFGEQYDDFLENHFPWNLKELFANEFQLLQPNKNSNILDIGCGTGLFGQELNKRGYSNIDGLDGSRKLEELCLKKGMIYKRFYEFCIQVGVDLPIEHSTYDAVLGSDVVYKDHISMRTFEQIIQVIKPGGLLGWSHLIWCKGKEPIQCGNPLDEDYECLQSLIERKLVKPIPEYFPKVVKSIPDKFEQRVWFVQRV